MSFSLDPQFPTNIDSTMVTAFRACPRKFFNEFICGLRPRGISIDLHAGACFAHALETVYGEVWINNKDLRSALNKAHVVFLNEWGDVVSNKPNSPKTKERVWEAVEDYFRTYPPHLDHCKPYFSNGKPTFEFSFAIPLEDEKFPRNPVTGDPILYSGRLDMLGAYMDRPVWRDEKTAGSSAGTNWTEKWSLRNQFIGYTWALRELGIPVEEGVVRGVGILKTKIDQAEAIKRYSNELIERWHDQLARDLHRIVDCWNTNIWDYNFADSCTAYGSCIFMTACQSAVPENWLANFEVRRWNPLAADPTTDKTPAVIHTKTENA